MKREFSAGGCVFKREGGQILWAIIKPRLSTDFPRERYQLPKGLIDGQESSEQAALREVKEETELTARIIQKIDSTKIFYTFRGEKIFKIITYYLMEYLSGEPKESTEVEKTMWLPLEEAKKILTHTNDKGILQKASGLLKAEIT